MIIRKNSRGQISNRGRQGHSVLPEIAENQKWLWKDQNTAKQPQKKVYQELLFIYSFIQQIPTIHYELD